MENNVVIDILERGDGTILMKGILGVGRTWQRLVTKSQLYDAMEEIAFMVNNDLNRGCAFVIGG